MDRDAQRLDAVRDDAHDGEIDHAAKRELGFAVLASALRERELGERIAEPAHQAAQEDLARLEAVDGVDRDAVEQQEIGAAGLDAHVADGVEQPVEQSRAQRLEERELPRRGRSLGDHDLRAAPPFRHHGRDQLRRMLEIAIHQDHRVAAGVAQARAQRRLVAEIAREGDEADAPIAPARPLISANERSVEQSSMNRISQLPNGPAISARRAAMAATFRSSL